MRPCFFTSLQLAPESSRISSSTTAPLLDVWTWFCVPARPCLLEPTELLRLRAFILCNTVLSSKPTVLHFLFKYTRRYLIDHNRKKHSGCACEGQALLHGLTTGLFPPTPWRGLCSLTVFPGLVISPRLVPATLSPTNQPIILKIPSLL